MSTNVPTKEKLKQMAEVMLAAAEGKKIEYKHYTSGQWIVAIDSYDLSWNWSEVEYRVYEEPDWEQKAFDLFFNAAYGMPTCRLSLFDKERTGFRAVINAVKRGELQ